MCVCIQSCLIFCDPMDSSPPDSSVHGIHQVRILEWVSISLSRGSSWSRDQTPASAGRFFATESTRMNHEDDHEDEPWGWPLRAFISKCFKAWTMRILIFFPKLILRCMGCPTDVNMHLEILEGPGARQTFPLTCPPPSSLAENQPPSDLSRKS